MINFDDQLALTGKNILVTGASSGIGRVIAILFSRLGAHVTISGRNELRLLEVLKELKGLNNSFIVADLSTESECERVISHSVKINGPLNGVVHCAGIHKTVPIKVLKESDFESIFNTNVKSSHFLAKFLRKKGNFSANNTSLVFMSSAAASCGDAGISTYSSSKAAIEGASRSLAIEFSKVGIRVNCIAPGIVETDMVDGLKQSLSVQQYERIKLLHPLGFGTESDVANSAAFLISPLSRWITGTVLKIDGGFSSH